MSPTTPAFQQNVVLFGHDPTPRLVAFELEGEDRVRVFARGEDGRTTSDLRVFRPFLLAASTDLLAGWGGGYEVEPLEGDGLYRFLILFHGWSDALKAKAHLQKSVGRMQTAPDAPFLFIGDPIQQYLMRSGQSQFRDLPFGTLRRLQLDIETYCAGDYDFPSAARAADRIIAIALADSTGWEHVISGQALAEPEMLREFVRIVRERDPDVIEGHNLFRFDLEYIEARARRHKVPLTLGRGGEPLRGHASRMQVAERAITYRKYEIVGRHILDTWILAQHYDVTARELEGYGLKEIARHFGVAAPDRTYLRPDKISAVFDAEPETVFRYALDDVREVRALSAILSQSYFVQAQIFPVLLPECRPAGDRHPDRRTADPRVPAPAASDSRPRAGPGGAGRPHRDRVPGGRAPGPALRRDLPLPVGDARLRVRSSAGQPGRVPGAPPRPPGLPGGGQAAGPGGGDGRDSGAL